MKLPLLLATFSVMACASAPDASAIILYGKDNSANQTDPGTGAPWTNVGRLTNSSGTAVDASAVYLGDRFVLTADHVDPSANRTHVTFDGSTTWAIEPGSHQQVASGVDLKVIRLSEDPELPALMLYEDAQDLARASELVGWGRGRDPSVPVGTDHVAWGDNSTIAKRWGTNTTLNNATNISYDVGSKTYSYEALQTRLLNTAGADEAAMTRYDSGGALFQDIGGQWYLSGIATTVERSGESRFGAATGSPFVLGDLNYFARVSTYSSEIYAAIPEPSSWATLLGVGSLLLAARIRFRRRAGEAD